MITEFKQFEKVSYWPLERLKLDPKNARQHSDAQVSALARVIQSFGFLVPILIDENGRILAGHGRYLAAQILALAEVPVLQIRHLSEAEKRAFAIADNRLGDLSSWEPEILGEQFAAITEIDPCFDLNITGFGTAEIDQLLIGDESLDESDDALPPISGNGVPVAGVGDLFELGDHRLLCGDAGSTSSFDRVMDGDLADLVFTDPPYNVRINGHVSGKGRTRHKEFAMASGELSPTEFENLLQIWFINISTSCRDGAIAFACMDWGHVAEATRAGKRAFSELKNMIVWAKTNAGMGSFYRSQYELILAFKVGRGSHINNFGLGETGRHRSNLWTYAGANSFGVDREASLAMHPTVKPVALVADAIRDCSHRGNIVLDPFLGSGTTIIAAEKTGRHSRGLELDPVYIDVAVKRWQDYTGRDAVHVETGLSFDELAKERTGGSVAAASGGAA